MSASAAKLATLYQGFTNQFANVKSVTAAQLHTELQGPDGKKITLIDVRTPEEQRVSRLPGSVLSKDAFEERSSSIAKSTTLVTYCTAGLRSGRYAEQLISKGFTDVRNLEGSILAWTQEGFPLVTGDETPTREVHVFSKEWALQGEGYNPQYFDKGRGVLATVRAKLPRWLGGTKGS